MRASGSVFDKALGMHASEHLSLLSLFSSCTVGSLRRSAVSSGPCLFLLGSELFQRRREHPVCFGFWYSSRAASGEREKEREGGAVTYSENSLHRETHKKGVMGEIEGERERETRKMQDEKGRTRNIQKVRVSLRAWWCLHEKDRWEWLTVRSRRNWTGLGSLSTVQRDK